MKLSGRGYFLRYSKHSLLVAFVVIFLFSNNGIIKKAYAADITISTSTSWSAGTYTYDNIIVTSGATLTPPPLVLVSPPPAQVSSSTLLTSRLMQGQLSLRTVQGSHLLKVLG